MAKVESRLLKRRFYTEKRLMMKPDIFILLRTGHFYVALTRRRSSLTETRRFIIVNDCLKRSYRIP